MDQREIMYKVEQLLEDSKTGVLATIEKDGTPRMRWMTPIIKSEVMEHLAKRLTVFWKVNTEKTDFIVLETIIKEATYFQPMKGHKETVQFPHS
jgi:uncharacterized pyridoxamine 5'-phosphate oxidase family protein